MIPDTAVVIVVLWTPTFPESANGDGNNYHTTTRPSVTVTIAVTKTVIVTIVVIITVLRFLVLTQTVTVNIAVTKVVLRSPILTKSASNDGRDSVTTPKS